VMLDARPIAEVIDARASCRDFAERPIAWPALQALARTAAISDEEVWGPQASAALRISVIAQRVAGGASELYLQRGAALERVGDIDPAAPPVVSPAQPHFGRAAAMLIAVGDVAVACRAAPTAGYFQLLLRAGGALHGAWLAATAHRIAAGMFAEIDVAACQALLRLGALERPLLALPLGYPRRAELMAADGGSA
jgi:Nitroreductase family